MRVAGYQATRLAHLMADLMLANDPKAKVAPDSEGWRDPMRLLMSRDGRTPEEIERVLRWCQADDFNRAVVLSPSKFRERFGGLKLQAERGASGNAGQRAGGAPTAEASATSRARSLQRTAHDLARNGMDPRTYRPDVDWAGEGVDVDEILEKYQQDQTNPHPQENHDPRTRTPGEAIPDVQQLAGNG